MNAPAHVNQAIRIGCIRFKHGRIRWHTAMKAQTFFKHAQNFVRIRTYGLYDKHTLGTR